MHWRVFIMFTLLFCLHDKVTFGQFCLPDVYAREFEGDLAAYYRSSIRNEAGELIVVGQTLQHTDLWNDPMITKYSPRGQVLWAKRYQISGYNNGFILSAATAPDSGLLVTVFTSMQRKRQNDGVVETYYTGAMLWKLDKFGNMIGGKLFTAFSPYYVFLNNILRLREGGYIVTGTVMGTGYQRNIIFRIDDAMNVVWTSQFHDEYRSYVSMKMYQRKNGDILMAGSLMEYSENNSTITKTGYYLLNVRSGGSLAWSRAYNFNPRPVTQPASLQDVPFIYEHENGNISLLSSYSDSSTFVRLPYVRSGLHLEVNEFGVIRRATGITHEQPGLLLTDAVYEPEQNRFILLTDEGEYSRISAYKPGGGSDWSRTLSKINGNLMGSSIYREKSGYLIYFRGRTQVANSGIIKSESEGSAPCMETPSQLHQRDVTSEFQQENISPSFNSIRTGLFEDMLTKAGSKIYPWKSNTVCETNCCINIGSDTTRVELCNQASYQLPDSNQISETGLYYINHKTASGCDSVAYYDVSFQISPTVKLGADTCFNNTDSLMITGPEGYEDYTWNNNNTTASAIRITQPGTYTLEVRNKCGVGKDSITVYKDCVFDILMPNAFTPNTDGRNDIFRVPQSNRNKLIRLAVFNRFGQKVFESHDINHGWDGTWKNTTQPSGTYIYVLEMMSLDGRTFTHKGTITLIR